MATRQYDFIVGPETSTLPSVGTPSVSTDLITLGYAEAHYTEGKASVADVTALKAVAAADRSDGMTVELSTINSLYVFDADSAAAGNDDTIVQPTAGSGRWYKVAQPVVASTDDRLPKYDGTGGQFQTSGISVTDDNDVSGMRDLSISRAFSGATSIAAGGSLDASSIQTLTSTSKGFLEPRMTQAQRDAIGTPATGLQIYNTDSNKLNYYNGSTWSEVGSGSSGVNYIVDADGSAIGSWATYDDGASATPVDGTGGSPGVTYSVSSSTALRGSNNFLFTHDAADRQGEGFSYNFTIDASDKGKVLQCSLEYLIASGTYADDGLAFWIYDVTNAALIQPAPYLLKNSGIIEKFAFEFQTSSSSTSYRLIAHVTTTTATAYTIRFDNWNLGPQAKLYGSPIGNLTNNYALTITGTTIAGSMTYNSGFTNAQWRRNGDSAEFFGVINFATVTTNPTGDLKIPMPSTLKINTSRLNDAMQVGVSNFVKSITGDNDGYTYAIRARTNDENFVYIIAGNFQPTFAANDLLYLNWTVPILGWDSQTIMSNDTDTRVVAASYKLTGAGPSIATATVTTVTSSLLTLTKIEDTHAAFNTTTGVYTIPVSGIYSVGGGISLLGAMVQTGEISIYVPITGPNAGAYRICTIDAHTTGTYNLHGINKDYVFKFNAGDTLTFQIYQTQGGSRTLDNINFAIRKLSGPAQIAASEFIGCKYTTNAGNSVTNSADNYIDFEDKEYDTHAIVSGTSSGNVTTTNTGWKATIPSPGKYLINSHVVSSGGGGWASGEAWSMYIRKNNVSVPGSFAVNAQPAAHTNNAESHALVVVDCLAGDRIEIVINQNSGAGLAINPSQPNNTVEIIKLS